MIVFTCEDTFEAMMTCIYDAWDSHEGHKNIRLMTKPVGNLELFCQYRHVETDMEKCHRVMKAVQQKISRRAYLMIFRCAASVNPDKLDIIYRFLLLGFYYGPKVISMLSHPAVSSCFELDRNVSNETHLFREFTRFSTSHNGILHAVIEPKSNILPLLYPAFEDRMPSENWMITDAGRKLAAVHPADGETYLTALSPKELDFIREDYFQKDVYTDMWVGFFQNISIRERKNPTCQRTHLPLWYRKYVPEFAENPKI